MKHFVVHHATTGAVIRYGMCQDDMLDKQVSGPTEAVIEAALDFESSQTATVDVVNKVLVGNNNTEHLP